MSESSISSRVSIFFQEHLTWKNLKRVGFWYLVFRSLKWVVRGVVNKFVYQSVREAREILAMARWSTLQEFIDMCEIILVHDGYAALSWPCVEALSAKLPLDWYLPYTEDTPSSGNGFGFFLHNLGFLLSPRRLGFAQQLNIFYTLVIGAAMVVLWKFTLAPSARPARYRRWFPRSLTPWLPWIPFISLGLFMSLLITFLLRIYLLIPIIWIFLEDLMSWAIEVGWQPKIPEQSEPLGFLDG